MGHLLTITQLNHYRKKQDVFYWLQLPLKTTNLWKRMIMTISNWAHFQLSIGRNTLNYVCWLFCFVFIDCIPLLFLLHSTRFSFGSGFYYFSLFVSTKSNRMTFLNIVPFSFIAKVKRSTSTNQCYPGQGWKKISIHSGVIWHMNQKSKKGVHFITITNWCFLTSVPRFHLC